MKVLLINPPTGLYVREDRCQSSVGDFAVCVIRPPMDLMYMAGALESRGAVCRIVDYPVERKNWKAFTRDFRVFSPDMLVLSITTPTVEKDMEACRIAKGINPGVITIAKGAHFLAEDEDILRRYRDVDIVVRGECEYAAAEIAVQPDRSAVPGITYREAGTLRRNPARPLVEDLDALPAAARHLVNNRLYTRPDTGEPMAVIEASRGCPGSCVFCLVGVVSGKKVRLRSPAAIVDEMEECQRRYAITSFHLKSDTFTWDKEWVIGVCREIFQRGMRVQWICNSRVDTLDRERLEWMKKAGCWAIGLGIESGSQFILDKIKKGITLQQARDAAGLCREFGIRSYAYFIIGFPWDTEHTIRDSMEFSLELDTDFVDFFLPYPFPGTALHEAMGSCGAVSGQCSGVKAYSQPARGVAGVSSRELALLRREAMRRFYLRPAYIARTLRGCRSPRVAWNYIRHGMKVMSTLAGLTYA